MLRLSISASSLFSIRTTKNELGVPTVEVTL
jgi:hypothetical protein